MKLAWETLVIAAKTLAAAAIILSIGCEGNISTAPQTTDLSASAPAPPAPEPPNGEAADTADETESADAPAAQPDAEPEAAVTTPESDPAADAPQPAGDETDAAANTETAKAGVGAKGRDYKPGFVTTPIQEYFRTGERIAFEIQIPSAMKLYKAAHDNKGPKTHEEFMNIIIKENAVQLPDLPAGDEFLYDPKTEELLVVHPAEE